MNHSDFYRKLEDRYRGDRSLIKERLKVYLQFVLPLKTLQSEFKAVDLGCGRGEWLELLRDHGVEAIGIDLDEGMLSACKEGGLHAEKADVIEALNALPPASMSLVTGFHVAEHLPFDSLLSLVEEAHRVLQPGGLLILETPNPENLLVAAHNFYIDPTHQRPLPPVLLNFTAEYGGFERSRILRLQEDEALSRSDEPGFWDVVSGGSPDYSVIAQKMGPDPLMRSIDVPFYADQGLKPETIALRYDQHISTRLSHFDQEFTKCVERLPEGQEGLERRPEMLGQTMETKGALNSLIEDLGASKAHLEDRERHLAASQAHLEDRERHLATSLAHLEDRERHLATSLAHLEDRERHLATSLAHLERGENILEAYQLFSTSVLNRLEQVEQEAQTSQTKVTEHLKAIEDDRDTIKALTLQLESTRLQATDLSDQLEKFQRSTSWRVTAPLRWLRRIIHRVGMLLKRFLAGIFFLALLPIILPLSPLLIILLPWILKKPLLRQQIGQRLRRFPVLLEISRRILRIMNLQYISSPSGGTARTDLEENHLGRHDENIASITHPVTDLALGKLSRQIHNRLKHSN